MRVSPTYWGSPSCEGLLYSCCIDVVQESNSYIQTHNHNFRIITSNLGDVFKTSS
jgi:hypothetical protein